MSADATADPLANSATASLLTSFWNNAQNNKRFSGAQVGPIDVGPWWHTADTNFSEFDQFGKTAGCGTPMILSCGINFLYANPNYVYGNPATGTAQYDLTGMPDHTWTKIHNEWVAHYNAGGIIKLMDVGVNPTAFASGSTTTTSGSVSSINSGGTLAVASLTPFTTYPFNYDPSVGRSNQTGGCGVIQCSDGAHYFTYTSASGGTLDTAPGTGWYTGSGTLNGVVIETTQRSTGTTGASVSSGAVVHPAQLLGASPGISGLALTHAWPLQWSTTACTEINADSATNVSGALSIPNAYTATEALSVNANYNLNRFLDYLSVEFLALAAVGAPIVLRLFPEPNFNNWWYSPALDTAGSTWYPQLFKYMVAYLTGNPVNPSTGNKIGFPTQPVAGATGVPGAGPCHNILFLFAMSYGNGFGSTVNPPSGSVVDLIGLDTYTATPTAVHTKLKTMQGWAGMSNKPGGCAEFYTDGNIINARGVCTTSADLSTATTLNLNDDWYAGSNGAGQSGAGGGTTNPNPVFPTTGGTISVPTSLGIQQVSYASCSYVFPFVTDADNIVLGQTTFTGLTTSAPAGSNMIVGALATQVDGSAGSPSTAATDLATSIGSSSTAPYPAFFVFWDGSSGATASELYVPGLSGLMGNSATINRPASAPSGVGNWSAFYWDAWDWK